MGKWLEKLLGFDELVGEDLVKVTYYVGLIFIAGWAVMSLLSALGFLFSDFFFAVGRILSTPVIASVAVLLWRIGAEWLINDWRRADPLRDSVIDGEVLTPDTKQGAADRHEPEPGADPAFEDAVDVDSVVIDPTEGSAAKGAP